VTFCGSTPADGLKDVEAPVLAHYAQYDFRVTGNALWTAHTMKDLGKRFTYYVYPRVNHGFFNSKSPQYDTAAEKLSWDRTLQFLRSPV
jgi:carboxymethylenebutenolidase